MQSLQPFISSSSFHFIASRSLAPFNFEIPNQLVTMAEIEPMSSSSSMALPSLPPTFAGAPGQQQPYDNGTSNGQGNPAHMPPPPLPPVVIPQNTNPIPTAMTSPTIDANGMMSPGSASSSFIRRAAPEPNKRALYVGGLDPRVTEDVLRQIFETTGHVQNVKIIPDKNVGAVSTNLFCFSPHHRVSSTYSQYLSFLWPVRAEIVLVDRTRRTR